MGKTAEVIAAAEAAIEAACVVAEAEAACAAIGVENTIVYHRIFSPGEYKYKRLRKYWQGRWQKRTPNA